MNTRSPSLQVELIDPEFSFRDAIPHLDFLKPLEQYTVLDRVELEKFLPHRGPALCIDFGLIPVYENPLCLRAVSISRVPLEGSSETEGHFPEKGLLPGHWAFEKMCLCAALLSNRIVQRVGQSNRKYLPVLEEIYRASFKQAIPPGSVVVMQAEYLSNGISIYGEHIQPADKRRAIFQIHAFVNGAPCIVAIIGAVLVPVRG